MRPPQDDRVASTAIGWGQWPLLLALVLYWITVGAIVSQSLRLSQGHLAYPLDDPYIHMAMAKNAALHGVWGVTGHEFSSTSSSPLWTALLAAFYGLVGLRESAPLWLNLVAGSLSLVVASRLLQRSRAGSGWTLSVLLALVFGGALPTLTITGMEHTLHGLVTLMFVAVAARVMDPEDGAGGRWQLPLLAATLALTRYEGLFAIAVVVLLLAATGKRTMGIVVAACAAIPLALYGAWSVAHGWYVLPNSVLLKGNVPDASIAGLAKLAIGWNAANALQLNPHVLVLVATSIVIVLALRPTPITNPRVALNAVFLGATLLHLEFAKTGWFFRYEAYLLMLGLVVIGSTLSPWIEELRAQRAARRDIVSLAASALLLVTLASPLVVRATRALQVAAVSMRITYEQQVQMGLFLRRYYTGRTVAVNDIGAVNYFADIRLVDLVGLGSMDVARLRRARLGNGEWIGPLSERLHAEIAVVYDSWLIENGGVPAGWHRVGAWTGSVPDSTVVFYAARPDQVDELRRNLAAYLPDLPPGVAPSGEFVR